MLDRSGLVIYVGKAKNLKKRVSSYFSKTHPDAKTRALVRQIWAIDTIVTPTEHDALVLENQLIKSLQPKYNICLKDDKTYPLVRLSTEKFPRLSIVRQKYPDGARYFGPFPGAGSSKHLLKMLNQLAPIRDCKQTIDPIRHQPKCIKLALGSCLGPCVIKDCEPDYTAAISDLMMVLTGRSRHLAATLDSEMRIAAQNCEFERAARIRDRLKVVEKMANRGTVVLTTPETIHCWVFSEDEDHFYLLQQKFIEGKLLSQQGFLTPRDSTNITDFCQQCVLSALDIESPKPDRIWADPELAEPIHTTLAFHWVTVPPIQFPKIGKNRQILDSAKRNATVGLLRMRRQIRASQPGLSNYMQLGVHLSLSPPPQRIWGFDISHLFGTNVVASAVCFFNGKPSKKYYRHFIINGLVSGISNDPESIREAIERRIQLAAEADELLPDLIMVDGGIPQLNWAKKALATTQKQIPLIALAKADEIIYTDTGKCLRIARSDPGLQLVQQIRDEAHRFAKRLQVSRRDKLSIQSRLSTIPGLGPTRIAALLSQFGTIDAIQSADLDQITKVGKIGLNLAKAIQGALANHQ